MDTKKIYFNTFGEKEGYNEVILEGEEDKWIKIQIPIENCGSEYKLRTGNSIYWSEFLEMCDSKFKTEHNPDFPVTAEDYLNP